MPGKAQKRFYASNSGGIRFIHAVGVSHRKLREMNVTPGLYFPSSSQQEAGTSRPTDSPSKHCETKDKLPSAHCLAYNILSARHRIQKRIQSNLPPQLPKCLPPELWDNVIRQTDLEGKQTLRLTSHAFERMTSARIEHIEVRDRESLEEAIEAFKRIREITLTGGELRNDDLRLLDELPKLERVTLDWHDDQTGKCLEKVPRLRTLSVRQATAAGLKNVYPNLEALHISASRNLGDADVRQLLQTCHHLRSLNISLC